MAAEAPFLKGREYKWPLSTFTSSLPSIDATGGNGSQQHPAAFSEGEGDLSLTEKQNCVRSASARTTTTSCFDIADSRA